MMAPRDIATAVALMAMWGFNFVTAKWALDGFPPILLTALRFVLVAAVLVPFVRAPRDTLAPVALLSVSLGSAHFSLMFSGLRDLDAGLAAIAAQTQVPFAALMAYLVLGEKLGARRSIGMAIAFLGVYVTTNPPGLPDPVPLALVVAASCLWGLASVQIKRLGRVDGMAINAYVAAFAVPQLVALSLVFESGQVEALRAADARAWASVAFMALAVTILGYGVWYRLLARHDVNRVMPFLLLLPAFGVASAGATDKALITLRRFMDHLVVARGIGCAKGEKARSTGR